MWFSNSSIIVIIVYKIQTRIFLYVNIKILFYMFICNYRITLMRLF